MNAAVVVLLGNAASTFALTGLIWTIQLVHYPAFRYVAEPRFLDFEAFHQRRIGGVVAPLMLIELFTTLALFLWCPSGLPLGFCIVGALLAISIWICTFAVQVPLHHRLAQGFDRAVIEVLIHGNWIRTILWSLRAGLMLWALYTAWPVAGRIP